MNRQCHSCRDPLDSRRVSRRLGRRREPSRLGPYEILVPIGAGGMGEVYEAGDTKLDRGRLPH
jgi:hypothetical protein